MSQWRKKPVVIEAFQLLDGNEEGYPHWLRMAQRGGKVSIIQNEQLEILTLEGKMIAKIGDWIIQGVKGEIYPCKSDIFDLTYEPVTRRVSP